jgi:hypothetical protein
MSKALPKRSVLPVDGKIWNSGFEQDSDDDKVSALKIDFHGYCRCRNRIRAIMAVILLLVVTLRQRRIGVAVRPRIDLEISFPCS